jgi:hypothetical protein
VRFAYQSACADCRGGWHQLPPTFPRSPGIIPVVLSVAFSGPCAALINDVAHKYISIHVRVAKMTSANARMQGDALFSSKSSTPGSFRLVEFRTDKDSFGPSYGGSPARSITRIRITANVVTIVDTKAEKATNSSLPAAGYGEY